MVQVQARGYDDHNMMSVMMGKQQQRFDAVMMMWTTGKGSL